MDNVFKWLAFGVFVMQGVCILFDVPPDDSTRMLCGVMALNWFIAQQS